MNVQTTKHNVNPAVEQEELKPVKIVLFGREAEALLPLVEEQPNLQLVESDPEVIVCYGGDGTLLAAELRWPGLPKVPILNSHRGHRCIPHPPKEVMSKLAQGTLRHNVYTKLDAYIHRANGEVSPEPLVALNEFNVHMGRINSAVRYRLHIDGYPYENGMVILGDGFVVCTPFGSTAYFRQITRGIFTQGIGVAFKSTTEHTSHLILPESVEVRFEIVRGPAVLAFDSSTRYSNLSAGDALVVHRHAHGANILTCGPIHRLHEPF